MTLEVLLHDHLLWLLHDIRFKKLEYLRIASKIMHNFEPNQGRTFIILLDIGNWLNRWHLTKFNLTHYSRLDVFTYIYHPCKLLQFTRFDLT